MEHNFSFETRVLACTNCGAPISATLTGGDNTCDYCGTINNIHTRTIPSVAQFSQNKDIPEAERLAMLRKQDGKPVELPPSLQPLVQNYEIPDWKLEEALALWNSIRSRLEGEENFQAAEELYFLTILLTNHNSYENQPLKIRALYESALDVFRLPRHRQSMLGLLSRNAARECDFDAAEKWLEPCDKRPMDLMSDSDYRVSRAYIDTMQGKTDNMLELLGSNHGTVPVYGTMDTISIILRANALEKSGNVPAAAEELFLILSMYGANASDVINRIIRGLEKNGQQICPQSLQMAKTKQSNMNLRRMTTVASGGGIAKPFAILGTGFLIACAVIVFTLVTGDNSPHTKKGLATALPTLGIIGIVFSIIGYKFLGKSRKIKRLHTNGIDTTATITGAAPTGWKINNVPQYKINLRVQHPEQGEYETSLKMVGAPPENMSQIKVKVDPNDKNHLMLVP